MASVHSLPVLYLISLLCVYLCSWMHIMSMLWPMVDAVSSGSCPILFKVLTLNVAICIVRLHFSNFCFRSEADFSNTEAWAPTSAGRTPFFFTRVKSDAVWTGGLRVGHGNLSSAVFILFCRSHPYRWAAVVSRSNYSILVVEPSGSNAQDLVKRCVEPSEGLPACFYVHHAVSHGFQNIFYHY